LFPKTSQSTGTIGDRGKRTRAKEKAKPKKQHEKPCPGKKKNNVGFPSGPKTGREPKPQGAGNKGTGAGPPSRRTTPRRVRKRKKKQAKRD